MTDTAAKRAAALGMGMPPGATVPLPDGTIDAADRAHLAGIYAPNPVTADNPDQLHFETRFKAAPGEQYVSNVQTISGLSGPSSSVVADGEQSVNGAAFTSLPVTVEDGDTLQLRRNASASAGTQASTTATIGDVVSAFVIVTAAAEVTRTRWSRRAVIGYRRRVA